jgi:site-specific recombinase XerD
VTPIAPHITGFLRERLPIDRRASEHTCDSYAYALRLLLEFASKRLNVTPVNLALEQIDAPLVLGFLEHLETARRNCPRSRNTRLAAIKSFARFVEYRVPSALDQVRRILAIPTKKTDSPLVPYLAREQMQAVLDSPNPTSRYGIRDSAMLHIAFAAGLRVSEIVGLRLDDLTFQPRPCVLVRGKGRKERALPLWKETAAALRRWLAIRGDASVPELFLNARGESMTRSGFAYVLAKHVAVAVGRCPSIQAKRVSPHVLRHTCAMITLQATGDVRKVALWLGHARLQTTETYLRADPTEKLDAIDAVIPPGLRRGRFRPSDALIASLIPGSARRNAQANPSPNRKNKPR